MFSQKGTVEHFRKTKWMERGPINGSAERNSMDSGKKDEYKVLANSIGQTVQFIVDNTKAI